MQERDTFPIEAGGLKRIKVEPGQEIKIRPLPEDGIIYVYLGNKRLQIVEARENTVFKNALYLLTDPQKYNPYSPRNHYKVLRKKDELTIGRGKLPQFELPPTVSRKHLDVKITRRGEIILKDLRSRNGTFIEIPESFTVENYRSKEAAIFQKLDAELEILLSFQAVLNSFKTATPPEKVRQVLDKALYALKEKADSLGESTFSDNLEKVTVTLADKNEHVYSLWTNRKKLEDELSATLRGDNGNTNCRFDLTRVKDFIFDPFNVSLVLSSSYFDQLVKSPRTRGFHLKGTVFNFIREHADPKYVRKVIDHEKLHGLVEGGVVGVAYSLPSGRLAREFEKYEKPQTDTATSPDEALIALTTRHMKKRAILQNSAELIINQIKEEILAVLESVELKPLKNTAKHLENPDDYFYLYAQKVVAGTAGSEILRVVALLQEKQRTTTNEEIKNFCGRLAQDIKRSYCTMVVNVKNTLMVSERISRDAALRTHGLCMILKPTQYRYIMNYLKYKYGKETVQQELVLAHALEDPLNVKSIIDLANVWPRLTYEEGTNVFKSLKEFDPDSSVNIEEDFGIDSLATYRIYSTHFKKLIGYIPTPSIDHARISGQLFQQLCLEIITNSFDVQFGDLPAFYTQLTAQEKKSFTAVLNEYVANTLPEEIDDAYPTYSKEQKEQLPLWDELKKLPV